MASPDYIMPTGPHLPVWAEGGVGGFYGLREDRQKQRHVASPIRVAGPVSGQRPGPLIWSASAGRGLPRQSQVGYLTPEMAPAGWITIESEAFLL
ncbi:MAG: hypothetical protein DRI39_01140 [Chloroflexi bacterium]|nr:MAG: hypothetical protein DRI39_01140 [Chloroflexota bacterium]